MSRTFGPKLAKSAPINRVIDRGIGLTFGSHRGAQLPKWGNLWVSSTLAAFRSPFWVTLAKFRPNLGDCGRTRTDAGQIRPRFGQIFAMSVVEHGPHLAKFDRARPTSAQFRPQLAWTRPNLVELDHMGTGEPMESSDPMWSGDLMGSGGTMRSGNRCTTLGADQ